MDFSNIHGPSIYWPLTASGSYASYVGDEIYNSTRYGTWDKFLQEYFGGAGCGGMPVDTGPAERKPGTTTLTLSVFLPLLTK